jgi:chemotaxis protein MotB
MSRRRKSQESVQHERWLISYADFVTLLFALFVVLFASSQHDKKSIRKVSRAVKNGFTDLSTFSGATSGTAAGSASKAVSETQAAPAADRAGTEGIDTTELQAKLRTALGKEIARQQVVLHSTPEGFVISLHELGFFDSGQATLLPGASDPIRRIAQVLMQYGLDMRVEGHSDNVPIHNAQFNSNWELSTGRATAVAMMLINNAGVQPERLSIAGYAHYRPTASNDTPEGRRGNRRVDLVIVSSTLPTLGTEKP